MSAPVIRSIWRARLWLVIAPIRVYQAIRAIPLWPLNAKVCRFEPTCSQYTVEAVLCFGIVKGVTAGTWRILRCNPWCEGGEDRAETFRFLWERNVQAKPPGKP